MHNIPHKKYSRPSFILFCRGCITSSWWFCILHNSSDVLCIVTRDHFQNQFRKGKACTVSFHKRNAWWFLSRTYFLYLVTCRLIGAKPSHELVLTYCRLGSHSFLSWPMLIGLLIYLPKKEEGRNEKIKIIDRYEMLCWHQSKIFVVRLSSHKSHHGSSLIILIQGNFFSKLSILMPCINNLYLFYTVMAPRLDIPHLTVICGKIIPRLAYLVAIWCYIIMIMSWGTTSVEQSVYLVGDMFDALLPIISAMAYRKNIHILNFYQSVIKWEHFPRYWPF